MIRSLAWIQSPGQAVLGAPVTLTLRGAPLTTLLVHLDERFTVTPVPGFETPYLGTFQAVHVATLVLGPSGSLPITFTVPNYPAWAGRMFYVHALAIEPGSNALSFTNLGDLVVVR